MNAAAIQEWLIREMKNPAVVQVCRVGTATWQTATAAGFTDKIPF
jgi:hypothetical protein